MNDHQPFFERVHEVTEFCVWHAGKCFGGWPRETVFLYVGFHALAGTIFVVREQGSRQISAVGFAWPFQPGTAAAEFNWHPVPPGPALMMREVVGTRADCRTMFVRARARWPHVERFFAYRQRNTRHELTEFSPATMERFCS